MTRLPHLVPAIDVLRLFLAQFQEAYGPLFCPGCGIDLLTNPETAIFRDLSAVFKIRCDCRRGAVDFNFDVMWVALTQVRTVTLPPLTPSIFLT